MTTFVAGYVFVLDGAIEEYHHCDYAFIIPIESMLYTLPYKIKLTLRKHVHATYRFVLTYERVNISVEKEK